MRVLLSYLLFLMCKNAETTEAEAQSLRFQKRMKRRTAG